MPDAAEFRPPRSQRAAAADWRRGQTALVLALAWSIGLAALDAPRLLPAGGDHAKSDLTGLRLGAEVPRLLLARGEDGKVTLRFTPNLLAESYELRCSSREGTVLQPIRVTDYTVHGLRNGTHYRFAVRAVREGRRGPESNELSAVPVADPEWPALREAFSSPNPTRNSNPFTMVHGNETEEPLRQILRVAYDAGFEGVTLHPYNYTDYLGPGQWDRWRILLDEARRLGLCIWQQDDRNYPSGFAAGTVVAAHPEFARSAIAEALRQDLTGPQAGFRLDLKALLKPAETLVAVCAYPADGDPLDLTDRVVGGELAWDVPAGPWRLFAVKAVRDSGPYIDFLSPTATDAYITAIYEATGAQIGAHFGGTFKGFFTDEAPVDFRQFTADLPARFEAAKGYSVRPWLPSLWADLTPRDRRVRHDWRDVLREQLASVFFGRSRDWCRAHGLTFIGHVIEDHQMDMRRLEFLDIPGFDHIFTQWYDPEPDVYWRQAKMASSVAHYTGSRLDLALVEHFAATGWRTGLSEMKRMMDWSTAMGYNQVVPCGLDTQDPPVWEVTPDFWLHGRNPQWPHFAEYQRAANRMTLLMRGGRHVAPVLVLDTTESRWPERGTSLDTPHSAPDDLWRTLAALGQAHLDHDLVPFAVFADASRTRFESGAVHLAQECYRAVVLPPVPVVPAAVAERLVEFARAGGVVVVVDRWPGASCTGTEDERVATAVADLAPLSANASYEGLGPHLAKLGIEDVIVPPAWTALLYCRRQRHGADLVFLANTGSAPLAGPVCVRRARGSPEFWDPVTGSIRPAPRWTDSAEGVDVWVDLAGGQSVFLVLDPATQPARHAEVGTQPDPPPAVMATLGPWTRGEAEGTFRTEFPLPADGGGWQTQVQFEGADQVLEVALNGQSLGACFTAPYTFAVGPHLQPGTNRLEVRQVERFGHAVGAPTPNLDDNALAYSGEWTADAYPPAWRQSRHYTRQPGAAATATFSGTGIAWIGERDSNRGVAEVFLDDAPAVAVDTYNGGGPEVQQAVLWRRDGLAPGEHRLRIVCSARKDPRSRDCFISVDALAVCQADAGTVPVPWSRALLVR